MNYKSNEEEYEKIEKFIPGECSSSNSRDKNELSSSIRDDNEDDVDKATRKPI